MYLCELLQKLVTWFWGKIIDHASILLIIVGFVLLLFASIHIPNFQTVNSTYVILYIFGFIISIGGILWQISHIARYDEETQWKYICLMILILAILLCPLMTTTFIKVTDLQAILSVYTATDIALLAIILAAITINPTNIISRFISSGTVDIKHFKTFTLLIPFTVFISIFLFSISSVIGLNYSTIQLGENITIYTINILFWIITTLTFLLLFFTMYYTQKILDIIIKDP